jgi:hypothetical protein
MELRVIEEQLEKRLKSGKEKITVVEGTQHFANYIAARQRLVEEILPEIKAIENSLTDHGERHIGNVLDNIYELIGKDIKRVTLMEHYFLCLLALFHDVGNIHGRKGHYKKNVIFEIYGYVRGNDPKFDDEKNLVAEVASKHSGKATDDSFDTIKELSANEEGLWGKGVNLRKCAAVLRFADELAEGIQRTSNFMSQYHKYDSDAEIHHKYAKCFSMYIGKNENRIALTYKIKIDTSNKKIWDETKELLEYIYHRIIKLNNERLYNKYYAEILSNFKRVEVVLNFIVDEIPIIIGLKQLVLTDLIIPGEEDIKDIAKNDKEYTIDEIIQKIKGHLSNVKGS